MDFVCKVTNKEAATFCEQFLIGDVQGNPAPRSFYNQIKNSGRARVCLYCGARNAETVDHYLPRSEYSQFAITPANLVPSCDKC